MAMEAVKTAVHFTAKMTGHATQFVVDTANDLHVVEKTKSALSSVKTGTEKAYGKVTGRDVEKDKTVGKVAAGAAGVVVAASVASTVLAVATVGAVVVGAGAVANAAHDKSDKEKEK